MENKTYYEILGVSPKCSQMDIKLAYRSLIKKYHPDKIDIEHLDGDCVTNVKAINKAYETLKNQSKRSMYDSALKIPKKKTNDFLEMKQQSKKFFEQMENDIKESRCTKLDAEKNFEKLNAEIDRKMGITEHIDSNRKQRYIPSTYEFEKQVEQIEILRNQEDIENLPTKIQSGEFNVDRFNQMFDEMIEKNIREKDQIQQYTGDVEPFGASHGCGIDDEQQYNPTEITADINGIPINTTTGIMKSKYVEPTKSLDELIKERESERNSTIYMQPPIQKVTYEVPAYWKKTTLYESENEKHSQN